MSDTHPCNPTFQVVVTDIGDASAALFSALKQAIKLPEPEIARRILQAPAVLAEHLNEETAKTVSNLLEKSGLKTTILPSGEKSNLTMGNGHYEIALSISSFKNIHEILAEIVRITGLDVTGAVQLLLKTPTVLLGNISLTTAKRLKKRFSKLKVDADISQPSKATYDLVLKAEVYNAQQVIEHHINTLNLKFQSQNEHRGSKTYSIRQVSYDQAKLTWQMAQENKIPCQLLNQDYQRYDIRLNKVDSSHFGELKHYIVNELLIPEKLAERVISSSPVVVAKQKSLAETQKKLSDLADLNCEAQAELVSSLTFDIEVIELGEEQAARYIFEHILAIRSTVIVPILKGKQKRIEGPFNYNQVRWAQHEFAKIHGKINLKKRG